ncbi:hypothetical protein [Costertonia aggregata]|nr:hypothetical protein [Costertonia aggregata]
MAPKVKSLIYFVCLVASIVLYCSTTENTKDTFQLAQHNVDSPKK